MKANFINNYEGPEKMFFAKQNRSCPIYSDKVNFPKSFGLISIFGLNNQVFNNLPSFKISNRDFLIFSFGFLFFTCIHQFNSTHELSTL